MSRFCGFFLLLFSHFAEFLLIFGGWTPSRGVKKGPAWDAFLRTLTRWWNVVLGYLNDLSRPGPGLGRLGPGSDASISPETRPSDPGAHRDLLCRKAIVLHIGGHCLCDFYFEN